MVFIKFSVTLILFYFILLGLVEQKYYLLWVAGHAHVAEALGVPLHIFFTMPWTYDLRKALFSFYYLWTYSHAPIVYGNIFLS